jgi:HAD superfamily hydrolase (TIGR01509 family)
MSKTRLYIFDLDDTLIHEGFEPNETKLCTDTLHVLNLLRQQSHKIVLCSRNDRSQEYLKATGIDKYFDMVIGKDEPKDETLLEIVTAFSDISHDRCYLYDDLPENIKAAEKLGIHGVRVNWETGIVLSQFKM